MLLNSLLDRSHNEVVRNNAAFGARFDWKNRWALAYEMNAFPIEFSRQLDRERQFTERALLDRDVSS